SKYSATAIRNNLGYLTRCDPSTERAPDKLFHQQGRKVFKEVVPLASSFISEHLEANDLEPKQIARYWLHQANQKLNEVVADGGPGARKRRSSSMNTATPHPPDR